MGDFYEMFYEDALTAARALELTLTSRSRDASGGAIPMCGVPFHAADTYIARLVKKGFRVAVCEQMEDPAEARKRGSKSVVRREVVRLVTPGTLTEESLLEARRHNYLAAWAEIRGEGAFAWVDVSTGELAVSECPRVRLGPMLARLGPREVLVSEAQENELRDLIGEAGAVATSWPAQRQSPRDRATGPVPVVRRRRCEVRSGTVEISLRHACEVSCRVRAGRLPGHRWWLHPKVSAGRRERRPAQDRIWVPRPCPRMPVLSFAIVVAPPGPGQGSAWSVVVRAASGRSPAHPCYLISEGAVGPGVTTERVWHIEICPLCNRAVTNASAFGIHALTLRG